MQEVFERIIDQLKAESVIVDDDAGNRAVEIIEQAAAESVDFEKVLKEKVSEETFSIISSSEKEFGDWMDGMKRYVEMCGELYRELESMKNARK